MTRSHTFSRAHPHRFWFFDTQLKTVLLSSNLSLSILTLVFAIYSYVLSPYLGNISSCF